MTSIEKHTTQWLMSEACARIDAIKDKVYLVSQVRHTEDGFDVALDSAFPVAWLNEKFRSTYGHPDDLIVSDVAKNPSSPYSLLSAGVFLWDPQDNLVLLERDKGAPSYAGALTEPAGRCAELPRKTLLKEINEEMGVDLVDPYGVRSAQALVFEPSDIFNALDAKRGVDAKCKGKLVLEPPVQDMPTNTTRVYLDGNLVDSIEGCSWFDEQNNTLEVRQSYALPALEEGFSYAFYDGEPFERNVAVKSLNEVNALYCTPTLEHTAWALTKHKERRAPTFG